MAKATPSPHGIPPGGRFRAEIEAAFAEGLGPDDMILRLTLRDAHLITCDPGIPLLDISYAGGVMRFLGVRVEKGGVPTSTLDRGGT